MTTKKPEPNAEKPKYEPTAEEKTAVHDNIVRKTAQPAPRIKVIKDGKAITIAPDHPNKAVGHLLLMEAFGTADDDFFYGLIEQLANAGSQDGQIDEKKLNFMFSIVKGIKPTDQIEAMLAAQMTATHMATMRFAQQLAHVENIVQQDCAERTYNKLARTFAAQIEALKRYRAGGEQKVTVSVSEGGQAIVGNVTQPARETAADKTATSPPALTDARTTPMPIVDESKERVGMLTQRRSNK